MDDRLVRICVNLYELFPTISNDTFGPAWDTYTWVVRSSNWMDDASWTIDFLHNFAGDLHRVNKTLAVI